MMTGMILTELKKVSDAINYSLFLQKLYATGFLKHAVNSIKSDLSNRSFLVSFENNLPQTAPVCCGVH